MFQEYFNNLNPLIDFCDSWTKLSYYHMWTYDYVLIN